MHVQARASTTGSAFPDDDEGNDNAVSASYGAGRILAILELLAEQDFNLRSAGGHHIEFGGEFAFAVDARAGDADHEEATRAAVDALNGAGIDAHMVEVQVRYLSDEPGALRDFVRDVASQGLLIEEISVGTPGDAGIPVQIYTAKAGG
ncbi:MAG TPA: hypothetical protein VM408_04360 [Methylomirabilota bacterium]|nr:hypothetical protein [Methylomirabilota bacterium]